MNPAFFDEMLMRRKTSVTEHDCFRHPLREQINLKYPLARLSGTVDRYRRSKPLLEGRTPADVFLTDRRRVTEVVTREFVRPRFAGW